jgi:hypothetical protein
MYTKSLNGVKDVVVYTGGVSLFPRCHERNKALISMLSHYSGIEEYSFYTSDNDNSVCLDRKAWVKKLLNKDDSYWRPNLLELEMFTVAFFDGFYAADKKFVELISLINNKGRLQNSILNFEFMLKEFIKSNS